MSAQIKAPDSECARKPRQRLNTQISLKDRLNGWTSNTSWWLLNPDAIADETAGQHHDLVGYRDFTDSAQRHVDDAG